jgi:hypothetical protein
MSNPELPTCPSINSRLLIVTPTLGTSRFLDETMASVRAVPGPVLHVISCPGPRVEELALRFPQCRVVADAGPKGGIYGALNAALEAVADQNWDWFTYINDDDTLGPGFPAALESHRSRAEPEPVVYGNVRLIDDDSQPFGWITTESSPAKIRLMLHQTISPLNQQGMIFSRQAVDHLKDFDLRYKLCADLDFWVRALEAGFSFRFVPLEVGKFRVRRGQLSADIDLTRTEFRDIVFRHLPPPPGQLTLKAARLRYRMINLPRYLERLRHRGLKTSEALLNDGR